VVTLVNLMVLSPGVGLVRDRQVEASLIPDFSVTFETIAKQPSAQTLLSATMLVSQ
jgi:hypothetical protein